MTNIDLRFSGYGNFSRLKGEVASLRAQFAGLNAEMAKASYAGGGKATDAQKFASAQRMARIMQQTYADALASSGKFDVTQQRIRSHTDELTKDLQRERLGIRRVIAERKSLMDVYKRQLALQGATVTSFTTDRAGNPFATMSIPNTVEKGLGNARQQLGFISNLLSSVGTQTVNWGKNTQWAGRQLTVGFTVPMVALGALSAKAAYDVDKNLTRIAKVYDTTNDIIGTAQQKAAARQNELNQLRADGLATAETLARQYGASAKDTLDVQAQLAATGVKGNDLQRDTVAVQRLAILGEFDYQKAVEASIAMQNIFNQTSSEVVDSFNYMNAVENATSLSMEDFATAVPIAGATVKQLGGNIKDLGVLLVAMKSRGIDAAEGANAVKSAMNRLLNPSAKVQGMFQQLTGESITQLVRETNGELIPTLQAVGKAMDGLNNVDRGKIVASLFGTYQNTRLSAALAGVTEDFGNAQSQVYRTIEINAQSAAKNQAIADQEMQQQAESASGKIRRAWATVSMELAKMGKTFLVIGADILNVGADVLKMFGDLPGPVQTLLKAGVAIAAITGPLLMLLGLFGNLTGQGIKVIATLLRLVGISKLETTQQRAAAAAASLASQSMRTETDVVTSLNQQLRILQSSLNEAAMAQRTFAAEAAKASGKPLAPTVGMANHIPTGFAAGKTIDTARAAERNAAASERQAKFMQQAAISGTALTASTLAMVQPWSENVQQVGQFLLLLGLGMPLIKGMGTALAAAPAAFMRGWSKVDVALASGKSKLASYGSLMGGVASKGNLLAIAITAAAIGAYKLWQNSKKAAENVHKMYSDATDLGDILGYTPSKTVAPVKGAPAQRASDQSENIQKFADKYGEVADQITKAKTEQDKYNVAISQGLKVINTGGTAAQAEEAVRIALQAGRVKAEQADAIILKFGVNFDDVDELVLKQITQARSILAGTKAKDLDEGIVEGMVGQLNPFDDKHAFAVNLGNEARAKGNEAGNSFGIAWVHAVQSKMTPGAMTNTIDQIVTGLNAGLAGKSGNDLNRAVAQRNEALKQFLITTGLVADEAGEVTKELGASANIADVIYNNVNQINGPMKQQLQLYGAQHGAAWATLGLIKGMGPALQSLLAPTKAGTNAEKDRTAEYKEQVRLLKERMSAKGGWSGIKATAWGDAMKTVGESMSAALDASFEGRVEAVQAAGERASNALEARQKKAQDAFENRWNKRKKALQAEADMRKRMYDAEIARIDALARKQTAQTDFSVALRGGNLDEAAKIGIEQDSAATKDALTAQQEREQRAFDKRMDLLDEQERREKAALDRKQTREKNAMSARNAAASAGAARQVAIEKAKFNAMLQADLAYTPKTQAEANSRIQYLLTKYDKMGINLRTVGIKYGVQLQDAYAANIVKASNELKSSIDWAKIGRDAASKAVKATWNMSLPQFMKWLESQAVKPKSKTVGQTIQHGTTINHGGGIIGQGSTGRAGYAMSNSVMPSEQTVLAQKGEMLVSKRNTREMPAELQKALLDPHRKWRTGGPSGAVEGSTISAIVNKPVKPIIKALGQTVKSHGGSDQDFAGGSDMRVSGVGWHKPWKGHHSTFNGHDWNLSSGTPIYAPHSGTASGYDIRGYEPRVSHGGHGYKSYGRVIMLSAGGANLLFAHNRDRRFTGKTKVKAGTLLGHSGETGNAHGPHSHIEVNRNPMGGFGPFMRKRGVSLRKGGTLKYDNTLVNGHKGETVLTENLTKKFKDGIDNMTNGGRNITIENVNVEVPAGTKNPEEFGRNVAMGFKKELDREESRYGVKR